MNYSKWHLEDGNDEDGLIMDESGNLVAVLPSYMLYLSELKPLEKALLNAREIRQFLSDSYHVIALDCVNDNPDFGYSKAVREELRKEIWKALALSEEMNDVKRGNSVLRLVHDGEKERRPDGSIAVANGWSLHCRFHNTEPAVICGRNGDDAECRKIGTLLGAIPELYRFYEKTVGVLKMMKNELGGLRQESYTNVRPSIDIPAWNKAISEMDTLEKELHSGKNQ